MDCEDGYTMARLITHACSGLDVSAFHPNGMDDQMSAHLASTMAFSPHPCMSMHASWLSFACCDVVEWRQELALRFSSDIKISSHRSVATMTAVNQLHAVVTQSLTADIKGA